MQHIDNHYIKLTIIKKNRSFFKNLIQGIIIVAFSATTLKLSSHTRSFSFIILQATFVFSGSSHILAQTPCINCDFEQSLPALISSSTQVGGWVINGAQHSSTDNCNKQTTCCFNQPSFSEIINTTGGHIDSMIGAVYPIFSVFGQGENGGKQYNDHLPVMKGNQVLRLNSDTSWGTAIEKASRVYSVTAKSSVLKVAYLIGIKPYHLCCSGAGFKMSLSSDSCFAVNTNACLSNSLTGFYKGKTSNQATASSDFMYSRWKTRTFDLIDNVGQPVTLSLIASRCIYSGHSCYAYLDTETDSSLVSLNHKPIENSSGVATATSCGMFTLSVSPIYESYSWQGPNGMTSNSDSIVSSFPGNYTVQLGQFGCPPITKIINVITPGEVSYNISGNACSGEPFTIHATGAVTYTWINQAVVSPSLEVTIKEPTVYHVAGTDSLNCPVTLHFTINPYPNPIVINHSYSTACVHDLHKLNASGAQSYTWQTQNFFRETNDAVFSVPAPPGVIIFTLTGKNSWNCKSKVIFTLDVKGNDPVSASSYPSSKNCEGDTIWLTASGNMYHRWIGPGNWTADGSSISILNSKQHASGIYTVTATNEHGCNSTDTTLVQINPPPYALIHGRDSDCLPFCSEQVISGLSDPSVRSQWTSTGTFVNDSSTRFCYDQPGVYQIQATLTDINTGCTGFVQKKLTVYEKPSADFHFLPEAPDEWTEEIKFFPINIQDENYSFRWIFDQNNHFSLIKNPVLPQQPAGILRVAFVLTTVHGCSDTIVKPVVIADVPEIYIPDAFTPNEDGRNDVFIPVCRALNEFHMRIHNRWGELIYESFSLQKGWDGKYKGLDSPIGIYVCSITIKTIANETKIWQKKISLIR